MSQKTSAHASQTAVNKAECVSMTGYAQARGEQNGWAIRVSVKSVNHRFLDVRFRLPEGFDVYELRLRQIIRERIHRGHIDVNVNGQRADQVRDLAKSLTPAFARRLQTRLNELLNGTGIEPTRLAQEAALLAERSDISEELDRLRSHLQQFAKLLDGAGELGKKLDFLLQEMHREANTMLSKTPGVESEALAITGLSLEIRAEIEKLREQVQNSE